MNTFEFWLMNNPIRGFIQIFEAKKLRKMSNLKDGSSILEIGCGQGVGTKLINKYFKPKKIVAIDLDTRMIRRAKRKIHQKHISFEIGNASRLKFPNESFDAIIDFGIIHHIPNWKDCLKELHRALKPGGQLILEDLSIETFETKIGKFLKIFLKHPYKQMFRKKDFHEHLYKLGFKIHKEYSNSWWFSGVFKK